MGPGSKAQTFMTQVQEMQADIKDIKRLVTEAREPTRHASTITVADMDKVEAALDICFVPAEDGVIDPDNGLAQADDTEFQGDENKHDAKRRDEYIQAMRSKMSLPAHLSWSRRSDDTRSSTLVTSRYGGGAELPFGLGCSVDAMIVATKCRLPMFEEAAIVATMELNKKVVKQSVRQTQATFVCASLKSQLPVISCVTDMESAAVAYYTSGKRRADGTTICLARIFSSPDAMLLWLGKALSAQSVPAEVLRLVGGEILIPDALPNPTRVRLPVPKRRKHMRGHFADEQSILERLQGQGSDDVACLRDVE